MNRRILALLLALVMVAGLMTGCASGRQEAAAPETAQPESPAAEETAAEPEQTEESPAEEEAPAEPETVSFTDSLGRTVELPADITRIAPSGAVATMILAAIAPECMVTINAAPSESQMAFLPANLAALPETGQMYGSKADLNLETLLAADPQGAIEQLRALGQDIGIVQRIIVAQRIQRKIQHLRLAEAAGIRKNIRDLKFQITTLAHTKDISWSPEL